MESFEKRLVIYGGTMNLTHNEADEKALGSSIVTLFAKLDRRGRREFNLAMGNCKIVTHGMRYLDSKPMRESRIPSSLRYER